MNLRRCRQAARDYTKEEKAGKSRENKKKTRKIPFLHPFLDLLKYSVFPSFLDLFLCDFPLSPAEPGQPDLFISSLMRVLALPIIIISILTVIFVFALARLLSFLRLVVRFSICNAHVHFYSSSHLPSSPFPSSLFAEKQLFLFFRCLWTLSHP